MVRWLPLLPAALCLLAGCEPSAPAPLDAPPIDAPAPPDVPPPRPDVPPPCELSCGLGQTCCSVGGAPACVVTGNDPTNCGACGVDCAVNHRGDRCVRSACGCGDVDIGCLGGPRDTCCVSSDGRGRCADLVSDFDDCGACGAPCDVRSADRCDSGRCVCGEAGAPCDTGEDCCAPRFGGGAASCVSLADDREHCGACGITCSAGDVCRAGVCVSARDAGPRDAGDPDAGAADAALADAGAPDASVDAP